MGALGIGLCIGCVLLGAEIATRVDDYVSNSIDLLETPSYEDLWIDDGGVRRGRPHARYKLISFNNVGLQGPDVAHRSSCRRVLFLGSSETFGQPAVKGSAYPSHIRSDRGCLEVLNSSIPGMSVHRMAPYWRALEGLRPDIVVIYPATHFYLHPKEEAPQQGKAEPPPVSASIGPGTLLKHSRFSARLRDAITMPEWIQQWRDERTIRQRARSHDDAWMFHVIPEAQVERLRHDTAELVDAVKASGARVLIISQAVRVTSPPRPEDYADLHAMRVFTPRATEETLAAFPRQANAVLKDLAHSKGVGFVDIAAAMTGRRDKFIDMVHFTPRGAQEVAQIVTEAIDAL